MLPVGDKPMLIRVVERLRFVEALADVVVATGDLPMNDPIRALCRAEGITCFSGSEHDVLDRYYRAAVQAEADPVLRVTSDCPLVDPAIVARALDAFEARRGEIVYLGLDASFPEGLSVEVMTFDALETAWREARLPSEREHVTPFIWKQPDRFPQDQIKNTASESHEHWSVDYPQDYEFVKAIYAALDRPGHPFGMAETQSFLDANPGLRSLVAGSVRMEGYIKSIRADPDLDAGPVGGHTVVTGCAGFIGSNLCDRLLNDGKVVIGIDSFEDYYPRSRKDANLAAARSDPGFTLREADILDLAADRRTDGRSALEALLDGADCVYHLAAQAGVRGSWGSNFEVYARNNVLATQRLLEACVAAGVSKVIYASSSSIYGDQDVLPLVETARPEPRSPYGVTKLAGEHLFGLYHANRGLDTTVLRFFTVYGPRQRPDMAFHKFIRALVEGREIVIYGDGSQTRDFTYIDDIVTGLEQARVAPGGAVMNLGGGNRVSLSEAIATLGRITGIEPRLTLQGVEAGDVRDTWASIGHAAELIGYRPTTSLEVGLAREVEWLAREVEWLARS